MTARQTGRRISKAMAERKKPVSQRKRSEARQVSRRRKAPPSEREQRYLLQMVICGGIFVLLVAVKLLLPGKLTGIQEQLSGALRQNMDIQAVFSAVGRAVSGESDVGGTLEDVYQAVFHPQEEETAMETAVFSGSEAQFFELSALDSLREFRQSQEAAGLTVENTDIPEESGTKGEISSLAYVLYSEQNLPENVSMEQAILGFDYCTPVVGSLSSGFGYREHPVEGEERFHYGMDIAAETGTAIGCFTDGTVKAVGESSSYGKYLIVSHSGGYETLYAHCSKITTTSGASVKEGEKIAEVGETGMATGPHLHFELHLNGTYLNPIYYVSLA